MQDYKVKERQNIFDVCIQELGNLELLFDMLVANSLDPNSDVYLDQKVIIPDAEIENSKKVQKYYKKKGIAVVSDMEQSKPLGDFSKTDFNNSDFKTDAE